MHTCLYLLGICVCSYEIDSVQTCLYIVFFFLLLSLYETVFSRLSVLLIVRIVWEELKWDACHLLKAPPPSS